MGQQHQVDGTEPRIVAARHVPETRSETRAPGTSASSPFWAGLLALYEQMAEGAGLSGLGFITPMTHNFCESCNRVRLTCTGTLYMCLGQDDAADLRAPLRSSESDAPLLAAIDEVGIPEPHASVMRQYFEVFSVAMITRP